MTAGNAGSDGTKRGDLGQVLKDAKLPFFQEGQLLYTESNYPLAEM